MTISWAQVYLLIGNMWFASTAQSWERGIVIGLAWIALSALATVLENRGK